MISFPSLTRFFLICFIILSILPFYSLSEHCTSTAAQALHCTKQAQEIPRCKGSVFLLCHARCQSRTSGSHCEQVLLIQNWLEPTRTKMAEDLTSTRPWASLYTHCNTSAKWHTHQHHDSWQLPCQQREKPHIGTEKQSCISSGSKPHSCSQVTHGYYNSHTFQFPPLYFNPLTHLVSLPDWGWKVDLRGFPLHQWIKLVLFQSQLQFCYWLHKYDQKKNLPGTNRGLSSE